MEIKTTLGSLVGTIRFQNVLPKDRVVELTRKMGQLKRNNQLTPINKISAFEQITGLMVLFDVSKIMSLDWSTKITVCKGPLGHIPSKNPCKEVSNNSCKSIW